MALVKNIGKSPKEHASVHGVVECDCFMFSGADGKKIIQLDTYGSESRKLAGKTSQSIQFTKESFEQLMDLGRQFFGPIVS